MNYTETAKKIIPLLGGNNNIIDLEHCSTRLRFKLIDTEISNTEELTKVDGVAGVKTTPQGLQIIIGQDVDDVFEELMKLVNINSQEQDKAPEPDVAKAGVVTRFFNTLTDCFMPLIPALVGIGMLSAVLTLLKQIGILQESQNTYTLLHIMAQAPLAFIPFMLASSASKRFNVNPYIAMCVAAAILSSDFAALADAGSYTSLFGIPVRITTYTNSIIPILLAVYVQSYVEKYTKKFCPKFISTFMLPLMQVVIMGSLTFIILGPLGTYIGDGIALGLNFLLGVAKPLTTLLIGAFNILLVSTGMHYSTMSIVIANYMMNGYDNFFAGCTFAANFALTGSVLAVSLKAKDRETKQIAGSTGFTALLGITEPAIYGVLFKYRKTLISTIIGGGLGGFISGIIGVNSYGMAPAGLASIALLIGPTFVNAIIVIVISFVTGFGIIFFTGYEKKSMK